MEGKEENKVTTAKPSTITSDWIIARKGLTVQGTLAFGATTATTLAVSTSITMTTTGQVYLRNTNTYVSSKDAGHLDLDASTSIDLNATLVNIASAATFAGVGTGSNGVIIKNPKNAAAGTLGGTALNVEIDIGGTPYYFAVYPTKS